MVINLFQLLGLPHKLLDTCHTILTPRAKSGTEQMAIDFSKLMAGTEIPLIEPRDIYAALPQRPWPYLRHEQGEVLEQWFERRSDRDIVIKQNTGGGKTVVGLLIGKSSLNEGKGPAAYFASDSYLVDQVLAEAKKLGIATASDPRDPTFISHESILVTTLQKLINGRSVFGVEGSPRPTIDLGTIIVDDAHAALATVEQQFRLSVGSEHGFYRDMLNLFEEDLLAQSSPKLAEIMQGSNSAVLRVPFWAWVDKQADVLRIAMNYASDTEDKAFLFQWPLIKDRLEICIATISGVGLDIKPPCPPIAKVPSFTNAPRRIYLTATLADDAILVSDFDVNPESIQNAVTPGRASDIGDRMILAPLELNPKQDVLAIRELARSYADGFPDQQGIPSRTPINVVVIVPSERSAENWAAFAHKTWNVDDLLTGVQELKDGHVGLVVLANKYDGIDLAGDACRLLILDGLPRSLDAVEQREASAFPKSHKLLARRVQRVEQGLGRGVRDALDYCAVLLLGDDLTYAIHDPKQRALFSPATRVQIDVSRKLAQQLHGRGLAAISDSLNLCLDRDSNWIEVGRNALAQTNYNSSSFIRPYEVAIRKAYNRALHHDYKGAEQELQIAINSSDSPLEKGWLMEQKASYIHFSNRAEAQTLLRSASSQNPHVLKPMAGVVVERVRVIEAQANAIGDYAQINFDEGISAILAVNSLLDNIQWDLEKFNLAEQAWEELGLLLGFGSERPELKYGKGPDNLWALTDRSNLIFELKTGALDQPIKKDYLDQLGGHIRWHDSEYSRYSTSAIPIFIHPSSTHDGRGTPPNGTRVLEKASLLRLKKALGEMTISLQDPGAWQDVNKVAEQLATHHLTANEFVSHYTIPLRP